jgi:hypothetical protein
MVEEEKHPNLANVLNDDDDDLIQMSGSKQPGKKPIKKKGLLREDCKLLTFRLLNLCSYFY